MTETVTTTSKPSYLSPEEMEARHGSQEWGPHPYGLHLRVVAHFLELLAPGEELRELAYGHDLLEDTATAREELAPALREPITLVSRNLSQGTLTYQEYISWLAAHPCREARLVKLADALANYSLCRASGNGLIKRYSRSIPKLWPTVQEEAFSWERVNELASQASEAFGL